MAPRSLKRSVINFKKKDAEKTIVITKEWVSNGHFMLRRLDGLFLIKSTIPYVQEILESGQTLSLLGGDRRHDEEPYSVETILLYYKQNFKRYKKVAIDNIVFSEEEKYIRLLLSESLETGAGMDEEYYQFFAHIPNLEIWINDPVEMVFFTHHSKLIGLCMPVRLPDTCIAKVVQGVIRARMLFGSEVHSKTLLHEQDLFKEEK